MALNLHLLRLFTAVARAQSFSRAAEALHISQPAVSRGVRELEDQLGNRLLERRAGAVVPTEAGRMLLRHANALFAAERAAEEDLAALRGLSAGSLAIGASTTISTWYLPPLMGRFHLAHPAVSLQLRIGNTAQMLDLLLARELDVALVEGPVEHPGVLVEPWRGDELVWIAAPTHPLARHSGFLSPAQISDALHLVREPGSGTRAVGDAACAAHGIVPRERLEVGGTETIKQMVAAGIGIALVSAAAVIKELSLATLMILNLRHFAQSRPLNRLRLPDRQPSPATAAFDRLLDQAR